MRTTPSERRASEVNSVSVPHVRRLIRSIKRLRLRSGRKSLANLPCNEIGLTAGFSFHCYRPRVEPHSVHLGFAVSPDDAGKSFTFSWEDGNKNRRLIVHTNDSSEESHSALETFADGSYHYHGDDSEDHSLGKW